MLKFCTLFNTMYLSRGLAMYHSLEEKCGAFHLYIIAFDKHCFDVLSRLRLPYATIISLKQFENDRLLAIKSERTPGEYCWTCASSTIKYCLETYDLDHCTYVDADLMFFSDPAVLIDEMGGKSVLITEHRFTERYDQSASSGIYCVQFMTFKNTAGGLEVLNWWIDRCIEWCFNQFEDGKFGDQKYLDDWHNRFNTVHVLKHLGGGVAPWNVQQYTFKNSGESVKGKDLASGNSFDLVFFHYHGFHYTLDNSYSLSDKNYTLARNPVKHIYRPYIDALSKAEQVINMVNQHGPSYELTNDIQWIKAVPGRTILFFLRGYYKNFYKKNALIYGFLN
ncbi:glycosyl transferase [Pedobacter ginsengisoli]|uniref:glycosyl transferase n=1 Tax=Pedobacter ginsengisoli TaxID=363852 RepID=UPI0025511CED|nr:glycosyl transferase [Pedobacter ginsengisoli]